MFAKIMAVVMAAILITTVGLSAVWWITLRNQQIDARLDYLIAEAQDIAYLAPACRRAERTAFCITRWRTLRNTSRPIWRGSGKAG